MNKYGVEKSGWMLRLSLDMICWVCGVEMLLCHLKKKKNRCFASVKDKYKVQVKVFIKRWDSKSGEEREVQYEFRGNSVS